MSVEYKGKVYKVKKRKDGNLLLNLYKKKIDDITEIKGLEDLKNLETLYLENNNISEIKGLENLKNLTYLNLKNNNISEIKGLENLKNLECLYLRNNNIIEIEGLENITNLKNLDLRNNNISEIKGLENLKNLEDLDLRNNNIAELKGLGNLRKLRFLQLKKNPVNKLIVKKYDKHYSFNYDESLNKLLNDCKFYDEQKQYKIEQEQIEKALELNPTSDNEFYLKAKAQNECDMITEALDSLNMALNINPKKCKSTCFNGRNLN